jgi:hypothetical protein
MSGKITLPEFIALEVKVTLPHRCHVYQVAILINVFVGVLKVKLGHIFEVSIFLLHPI